ncbi:MAG: toprim domain-containing protein [Candidatus Nanoarchaeia archaeon]
MLKEAEAFKFRIQKLNESVDDALIVVEGQKDKKALELLLKAELFILNKQKRSLYEAAEEIAKKGKKVILMLDADRKGRDLERKLSIYLQSMRIDVRKERQILKLAKVRAVEDLASAVSGLL